MLVTDILHTKLQVANAGCRDLLRLSLAWQGTKKPERSYRTYMFHLLDDRLQYYQRNLWHTINPPPSHQQKKVSRQTRPPHFTYARSSKMSETQDVADDASGHRKITITLSVLKRKCSDPVIHIRTFLDSVPYTTNEYLSNRVYQSTVWPEELRLVQRVSVAIALGDHCSLADRVAMNQTLAGLLTFLDPASKIDSLRIQPLDSHNIKLADLVEVLQPVAIWSRRMPEVAQSLTNASEELVNALLQSRRSLSRTDDSIERLYSSIRTAARAAARLHQAGLHSRILGLNRKLARIMADVGFIEPAGSARAEDAVKRMHVVLAKLLDGV